MSIMDNIDAPTIDGDTIPTPGYVGDSSLILDKVVKQGHTYCATFPEGGGGVYACMLDGENKLLIKTEQGGQVTFLAISDRITFTDGVEIDPFVDAPVTLGVRDGGEQGGDEGSSNDPITVSVTTTETEAEVLNLGIEGKTPASIRVNKQGALFHSGHLGVWSLDVGSSLTMNGAGVATEEYVDSTIIDDTGMYYVSIIDNAPTNLSYLRAGSTVRVFGASPFSKITPPNEDGMYTFIVELNDGDTFPRLYNEYGSMDIYAPKGCDFSIPPPTVEGGGQAVILRLLVENRDLYWFWDGVFLEYNTLNR